MQLIEGVTRAYDWGSPTVIPELIGRTPTGEPVAELWLGAHPTGPALVGPGAVGLDHLVAHDPVAALGPDVAAAFDGLPFLLKVLAVAEPLSLQAHPSSAQAAAGYDREEAAGVPIDAPERSFRDRSHKPELICALSEFRALCGFRDPHVSLAVLESIETPALDPVREVIAAEPTPVGLARVLRWLLTLGRDEAEALVGAVVRACDDDGRGPHGADRALAVALGRRYPGDAGVVTALLLNPVTLQPGEAVFLGAGTLHMYLHGAGVEVMASSDNVLRGGLTTKHVDVEALLEVVDPTPLEPVVQRPVLVDGIAHYESPVPEFSLDRIEVDGEVEVDGGPAILLCTSGRADCGAHTLERGTAAWVPATEHRSTFAGRATVFRAAPGGNGRGSE